MKLKYYLRGLGIGIIVTTLIMCVSGKDTKMTEAEIRQEAMKLGMVDGTQVLSEASTKQGAETANNTIEDTVAGENVTEPNDDTAEETTEEPDDDTAEETTEEPDDDTAEETTEEPDDDTAEETTEEPDDDTAEETTEEPDDDTAGEKTEEPENDTTGEQVAETAEPAQDIVKNGEEIIIVVQSGDGSRTLARKLKEAGVIEDVIQFDDYLCANGYDKRICTGNHVVKKGMSDEELAKIFTKIAR